MEPDSDSVFENDMESDNGSDFENDVEFDSVSEFMKLKPDQRAQILIFENQIHYVTMFGILENRRSNVDFDSLTASLPRGESMELTLLQIRWWLARVSVVPYEADPGSKQKQHQYSDLFGQSFESLEDLHYATKALAEFYESVTPRQRLYAAIIHYIPFVVFTRARKSDPGWRPEPIPAVVLCERLAIARQAYYVELQSIVRSLAQSWWIVYLSLNNRSHIFEVFEESARLYAESSEACDQHNNLTLAVEKAEGSHAKMTDAHKPFRNLLYWKKWRAIVIGRYIQCIKPKQEMWLNIFATILIAAYNLFAYWYRKPVYKFPYERSTPETTQNSM